MRRTEALQGVRMIKFLDVLGRYEAAEFNQLEAAELLGIGERTFRRWRQRFEDEGEAGLLDRRLGKASGGACLSIVSAEVETLYRTRYSGFTAKHFHEHLVQRHNFAWSYTWTKTFLHSKGLLERAKRRGAHRRKRPRRPLPGMMLHQDGSRHAWLGGQPALDLIVTLDDATSAILSAFLVEEEGTASTFRALREVFERHGLPLSLYTDRGAHYFHTADADEKAGRAGLTQVGRALEHLGVEHIAAYSPQARGRSERAFHTLQDRLTKELALAGIATIRGRQRLHPRCLHPRSQCPLRHRGRTGRHRLRRDPRRRSGRGSVRSGGATGRQRQLRAFKTLKLQIPESPLRAHFVKARVKVRQYPDGTHAVFHGQRCLGRYDQKGNLHRSEIGRLNPLGAQACGQRGQGNALAHTSHRRTKAEEADI